MENIDTWCKGIILVLNKFDGWKLGYVGDSTITALGKTPKDFKCVLNIHFDIPESQPYILQETWDDFQEMNDELAWVYMYITKEANYMYWMNITDPVKEGGRLILKKEHAQIINYND